MLRFVHGHELGRYPKLRHEMFRDRAKQFRDRLGWPLEVNLFGEEIDEYDSENPLYVIWETDTGGHGGSMRLLPTTGRTMVNDHFRHLTDGVSIISPVIWESTRFCLSEGAPPSTAAALMLGGGEVMDRFGIEHFVGVFDLPMERIYKRIGASPTIVGSRGYGRGRTSVGLWSFSGEAKRCLAERTGIALDQLARWADQSFLPRACLPEDA